MKRLTDSRFPPPSGNLTGLPDGVIIGAAFLFGAVVGSALTLLASQPDEGIRQLVRKGGSRKARVVSSTSSTSLKEVLLEEASHVIRAAGSQLSQTLADQARDYVAGALTARTQKSSENAEGEPVETELTPRPKDDGR